MEISSNLSPVRGPSVWTRDLTPFSGRAVPRLLFTGFGLGLLAAALASRGRRRAVLACAGSSLLAAGAAPPLGRVADSVRRAFDRWRRADPVMEASEESFPASDSPSWTPAIAGTPERG